LTALLAILGLVPSTLSAGDYLTRSIGPYGGAVYTLAIDPQDASVIYAGTAGVFKTTNGGSRWTTADSGITGMIPSLAIDPQNTAILYAATATGVFKSVDGGATWNAANSGMPMQPFIRSLAIDPRNSATIYAELGYPYGVYKTTEAGANWSPANSGLPAYPTLVFNLAIDPKNSGTVYIGMGLAGVYKTTDGGASWSAVNSGLVGLLIGPLAIDPQNPSTLYAGWWNPPGMVAASGVRKSTDGGATWRDSSIGLPSSAPFSVVIDPHGAIYAGLQDGVFKSTDGGASWSAANSGLPRGSFTLAVDPQNPGTLYAGHNEQNGFGVFKSTDGGGSWNEANSGLAATHVSYFAIDPWSPGTVYAALWPCSASVCFTETRLFKTMNGGASWSRANSGLPPGSLGSLVVDPQNPATLYACVSEYTGNGAILPLPVVFQSMDGGTSWRKLPGLKGGCNSGSGLLSVDPHNSATLYAVVDGGVSKSTDEGASWVDLLKPDSIDALAMGTENPSTIYAGSWNGPAYKSVDGGTNWTLLRLPADYLDVPDPEDQPAIWSMAVDPQDSNTAYVGGTDGVLKSGDGGTSWSAVNSGLLPGWDGNFYVASLLIDPNDSNTIYAGTVTGIFKSTNAGGTWRQISAMTWAIPLLGLDPRNSSTVYATTSSRGIVAITPAPPSVPFAQP
jgi:photosystem II stability/assembly factor-like uncharacterized protein